MGRDAGGYLTPAEAGRTIGRSATWVREQIHAQRLAAKVMAAGAGPERRFLISRAEWERFLARALRDFDPGIDG